MDKILSEMGLPSDSSYTEIHGGKDSSVFRIEVPNGLKYVLRLLPSQKCKQFTREKNMIELANQNGVKVPKVYSVIVLENYAAMLMEWISGRTILCELQQRPENAEKLGVQFGKVQACINRITIPDSNLNTIESWLSPANSEETEVFNEISHSIINKNNNLLHLDFHPLNVLTDGEDITAVIDWANAYTGDYRFDFARTLSILQLEGYKIFKNNPYVITTFVKGWQQGYEESFGTLDFCPFFISWAGLRMKSDLAGTLLQDDFLRIEEWEEDWLKKCRKSYCYSVNERR